MDTVPPTVAITSPANGATVSGNIKIIASPADAGSGVASVSFYVDGSLIGTTTSSPWQQPWNTKRYSSGQHVLTVVAADRLAIRPPRRPSPSRSADAGRALPPHSDFEGPPKLFVEVNEPRLHRRQFIVGPEPVTAAPGWTSTQLSPSLYLSHCPELAVGSVTDRRGARWWLLGIALQSDRDAPSPLEQLAGYEGGDLLDTYRSWAGRWVLIGDSKLHLDACGVLGCFYRAIHRDRASELWASSSPALISALPGRERVERRAPGLRWGKGMEWYPPPRSGFPGINRLLPSQILSLRPEGELRVTARPLLVEGQATTYDELLDVLEESLVTPLSRLGERSKPVWLPLTAGYDSRLVLAAARSAELPVQTFTQEFPLMASGDRRLPPLIARDLGYEHRFIRPGRRSGHRQQLFDAHTAKSCLEIDRRFVARRQWEALPAPATILRGASLTRCTDQRVIPKPVGDVFQFIIQRFHLDEYQRNSYAHFDGIAEWLDWIGRTPPAGMDWHDRFFVEQDTGGWVSAVEQALDVTAYDRVYIANSHSYISTAMTLPKDVRRSSRHHVDLIRRMAPELLSFPFNPEDDAMLRVSVRLRDELHAARASSRKTRYAVRLARRGSWTVKGAVKKRLR